MKRADTDTTVSHDNEHERVLAKPSVPVMKVIDGRACWLKFGTTDYVWEPELERIYMAAQQRIPAEYLNQIVTGDARELAKRIPDESIDLVFTDPPYPKQFDGAFSTLASFAGRVLKPGGRLMFLVGHYQLPLAITEISRVLTYDWIIAQAAPGKTAAMFQKRVWASWKPCLVFRKGTITKKMNFAMDLFTDTDEAFRHSKQFHKWGQGAGFFAYYIDRWTKAGDVILDPFCGGGTTAAVCKTLGRNYITFDIDPASVDLARTRLANTQAIDPIFLEEQATLFDPAA